MRILLKRIYEPAGQEDGYRVLVDRIWPRGVARTDAALDEWCRELAPSAALRKWFGHAPSRWGEFRRRYRAELDRTDRDLLMRLRRQAENRGLTLLFAARDTTRNNAVVLKQYLEAHE